MKELNKEKIERQKLEIDHVSLTKEKENVQNELREAVKRIEELELELKTVKYEKQALKLEVNQLKTYTNENKDQETQNAQISKSCIMGKDLGEKWGYKYVKKTPSLVFVEVESSSLESKPKSALSCHFCGEAGHFKFECPIAKRPPFTSVRPQIVKSIVTERVTQEKKSQHGKAPKIVKNSTKVENKEKSRKVGKKRKVSSPSKRYDYVGGMLKQVAHLNQKIQNMVKGKQQRVFGNHIDKSYTQNKYYVPTKTRRLVDIFRPLDFRKSMGGFVC